MKLPDTPLQQAAWIKEGPDTWPNDDEDRKHQQQPQGDWWVFRGGLYGSGAPSTRCGQPVRYCGPCRWVAPLAVPQSAYELHFAVSAPASHDPHSPDGRLWDNNAGGRGHDCLHRKGCSDNTGPLLNPGNNFYLRVAPPLPNPAEDGSYPGAQGQTYSAVGRLMALHVLLPRQSAHV